MKAIHRIVFAQIFLIAACDASLVELPLWTNASDVLGGGDIGEKQSDSFCEVYSKPPPHQDAEFGSNVLSGTHQIEMVSIGYKGEPSNGDSFGPTISADGRFVAFRSLASNLVSDDTNGVSDIFVYDRRNNTTRRVSIDSQGNQANGDSLDPTIARDGCAVVFRSDASNLVIGDTNEDLDAFLHDLVLQETIRLSADLHGREIWGNGIKQISISGDGRYVAFDSTSSSLVEEDTNGTVYGSDVFVYDRNTEKVVRASVGTFGEQGNGNSGWPFISENGDVVFFTSAANSLVPQDTNELPDFFLHELGTGVTKLIDLDVQRVPFNDTYFPSPELYAVSGNGRFLLLNAAVENFFGLAIFDLQTGIWTRVGGAIASAGISDDGKLVVFESTEGEFGGGTNNVRDVFVHSLTADITWRISVPISKSESDGHSGNGVISPDGRVVAFASRATNFVVNDGNGKQDIFVVSVPDS